MQRYGIQRKIGDKARIKASRRRLLKLRTRTRNLFYCLHSFRGKSHAPERQVLLQIFYLTTHQYKLILGERGTRWLRDGGRLHEDGC